MALCRRFVSSKSSARAEQPSSLVPPDRQVISTSRSSSTTHPTPMNSSDGQQRYELEIAHPTASTATTSTTRSGSTLARRVLSLFRSRSEPNVPSAKQPSPPPDRRRRLTGPPRSTSASPCGGSVTASTGHRRGSGGSAGVKTLHQRRRYQRVVRDENARPPDKLDDNPFVTRKFTQEYLTNYYADKKPFPAEPSMSLISPGSHPILKKRLSSEPRTFTSGSGSCPSTDDESGSSLPSTVTETTTALSLTPTSRHAKFREVVEIVEYQMRDRVTEKLNSRTQSVRLNDSDDEGPVVNSLSGSEKACERNTIFDLNDVDKRNCCTIVDEHLTVRNVTPPLGSPGHHRCRPPPKHRRLEGFEEEENVDAEQSINEYAVDQSICLPVV